MLMTILGFAWRVLVVCAAAFVAAWAVDAGLIVWRERRERAQRLEDESQLTAKVIPIRRADR